VIRALVLAGIFVVGCGGAATASPTPPQRTATQAASRPATPPPAEPCPPIAPGVPTKAASIEMAGGGVIRLALRPDKAPNTVANFAAKASAGAYNGLTFHRVVPGFVVQGGDPRGDGTGGGNQPTELSDLPFCIGSLGVARAGDIRVSNDMQFFICIGACRHLDGGYTNFGQVTAGMDVAAAIKMGDKIKSISVQ